MMKHSFFSNSAVPFPFVSQIFLRNDGFVTRKRAGEAGNKVAGRDFEGAEINSAYREMILPGEKTISLVPKMIFGAAKTKIGIAIKGNR